MEENKRENEYSLKKAIIDGKEIWTAYNEEFPWRVGQGETEEEAVNDYLASGDFLESEEEYEFPTEESEIEAEAGTEEERKESRKKGIILLIIIVAICAMLVGAIAYIMPKLIRECIDNAVYSDLEMESRITYSPEKINGNIVISGVADAQPMTPQLTNTDPNLPGIIKPNPGYIYDSHEPTEESTPTPPPEKLYTKYKRDFDKLKSINKDCVGWLEIPDTKVSYPVVYSTDSQKYLDTGFDGKPNRYGTIFITGQVGLKGQNITLYGHASTYYESMFSTLKKYRDVKFYNKHKEIFFTNTSGVTTKYTIFAVIGVSVSGKTFNYRQANFLNDADLQEFVETAKSLNIININESVPNGSKLISLSTCMKGDKRLVVIGHS